MCHLGGSQNISKLWWRWIGYEYDISFWMEASSRQSRIRKLSPPTQPNPSGIGLALLTPLTHQAGRDILALCSAVNSSVP